MRDLLMFAAMFMFVPLALMSSTSAYLLWGWTAVLSPVFYLFGFMQDVRYNLIFATIALVQLLLGRTDGGKRWQSAPTTTLLTIFLVHAALCAAFAYDNNFRNADLFSQFAKTLLFAMVMPVFITTRQRLHAVLIMIALGLAFHGTVEGLKVIKSGGSHHPGGIPTTMMSDNNHFAVGMAMVLPLVFYLYQYSSRALVRYAFAGSFFMTVICVLGTQSRGGFIAVAAVGAWMVAASRRKVLALVMVILTAGIMVSVAPDSWFNRMETIQSADEDSSFMGRVASWKISSAVALANPVFGGGFHAQQFQPVWEQFRGSEGLLGFVSTPAPDLRGKAAHNIFFEVMGDLGFVGWAIFVAVMINAYLTRRDIRRRIKSADHPMVWASDMADLLWISVVAYGVGGSAVSLAYFESYYMVVALLEALRQVVIRTCVSEATPTVSSAQVVASR